MSILTNSSQFPALTEARQRSNRLLARLAEQFSKLPEPLAPITAIIAAGSLGRLEANATSDLDCVILREPGDIEGDMVNAALSVLMAVIEQSGLRAPKRDGIYRHAISVEALCESSSLGDLTESPEIFGKRMQLLLDSRAITGEKEFVSARQGVLEWYRSAGRRFSFEGEWDYLLRDLMRYAHSYWNWQLFKFDCSNDDSWFLRQAKLRSSRILTWFGLWVLVWGAAERGGEGSRWLAENLDRTPLERVELVMGEFCPEQFHELAVAYEAAFAALADPVVRRALLDPKRQAGGNYRDGAFPEFDRIILSSAVIRERIAGFIHKQSTRGRRSDPQFFAVFNGF
ncbi:MAG: hypothetical protein EXR86_16210 [Gammaproteobacteria bacterium]|nr:hypothetical protein [Gammaproteobacteria bacterium]